MSERRCLTRRDFMRTACAGAAALPFVPDRADAALDRPNVLFIAIDDLNDWTGCLGGHPQARTPNLDRLAARGVLFTNAHCAAPACNPSRAALMTGIRPSTSGVYTNSNIWRESPVLSNAVTIPQHFRKHGYSVAGSGKIYHGLYPDPPSWDEYWPSMNQTKPEDPMPDGMPINGIPNTRHFDWGPVNVNKGEMGDWQVADWISGQLGQRHDRPFFLACGFYRPHLPWYVPPEYFDMFPLEDIVLPEVRDDDLDDVPEAGRRIARPEGDHANVTGHHQWRQAVRGYLASIAFADDCLGRVIDALDRSGYKDNTVIVLWSDHGWHLGEKLHWRKFALWEEATHNVLAIIAPGVTAPGGRCDAPVNLLDIYPTLIDVCGLKPGSGLEGKSLEPQLRNPSLDRDRPTVTTHGRNNHSVRSKRYRYIQYADGSEELYDHAHDPLEWKNIASDPAYRNIKKYHARWLPRVNVEEIPRESADSRDARQRRMNIQLP